MGHLRRRRSFKMSDRRVTRRQVLRGTALGLGLPAVSALLAACGRDHTDELGLDRLGDAPAPLGPTLSFLSIQPHERAARQLASDFQVATGAFVRVTIVPYDQIRSKAIVDVQSGAAKYDVFDYWYTTVGELAHQGVLSDLTELIAASPDIEADDFISSIYDPYTLVDGKRYGLPFDGDSHVLFYNQDLLARSGFGGPPGTWEQYVQMARKITDDDGRPALDSRAVAAANSMHELAAFTPSPVKIAFEAAVAMFLQGRAAMMEFWTDLGVNAEDPKQSKVRGRWGVTSLPVGSPNSKPVAALNAGFALGVSRASRNQDLATHFVKFATSKATNLELITTTGSGIDPTRRSTLNSPRYSGFAPMVQRAARSALSGNGAIPWPTTDKSPELMEKLSDELSLMLHDRKTPVAAITDTQSAWQRILEQRS